ncbi:hypothetical protein EJ04DRAFT_488685 [Polyplosphaeria fusca]|uniref:Rhodopsin domain-containing protein n=1 Tax=Polyplosphaeria fusca TaxID=682080 RepID=A0A9P4R4T1_9PLEO|nr:hypothetical protein EJ04DRAFT_488685 [Polyplosphaeria fusca]
MQGRANEVLAVAILFFALTWLTVSLRIYVRGFMLDTWGRDDTAMAVTLFWYLCELLYIVLSCTLKISLGIFYMRVAVQNWHIWCIKLLMIGTVVFGSIYFFLVMFQCIPVSEFWNNHPASSRCIPKAPTTGISYALGALNASADWGFGLLPFFIVWSLQMNVKTKMLVAGILAFASIGSTATIVRMQYLHTLTNGEDFLWATTDVAIWSTVEPGIGITAGSLATLRPLLQSWLFRAGFVSEPHSHQRRNVAEPSSRSSRKKNGYHRGLGLTDLVPTEQVSNCGTVNAPRTSQDESETVSRQYALDEEMGLSNKSTNGSNGPGPTDERIVVAQQIEEGPPRLHLRDSLRNSFRIDVVWSWGK